MESMPIGLSKPNDVVLNGKAKKEIPQATTDQMILSLTILPQRAILNNDNVSTRLYTQQHQSRMGGQGQ